ncbi:MAG: imidazole glycerol phosphate synthase subunit HisF [Candidatus Acidulodesulfobacterium ferriphilum]|uniref:Imidazole glycerol phosphate synthase subunit HisF n=1 Tax=Candidatus Acidulodesulfobacterium ferriphilum TaxID=2597223 RepID=A0A519B9B4_9DELT|nr:MAG: imidazole glycerol phosphate synthase subunit HisF [Candidatus Acidulodesulfobacterium ferriphilum]
MLAKRIIPCLDIKNNEVVKGIHFEDLQSAGDPLELAKRYNDELADELMFLDITASHEKRKTILELVRKVSENIFIPFSVGGGVSDLEDIRNLLNSGADKVSINTAAVLNPDLIDSAAKKFGSSTIVIAIDAKKLGDDYIVFTHGGRNNSGVNAVNWAKEVYNRGAGEILLTSMDRDGTKNGYEINLTSSVVRNVKIPVIASGGARDAKDMEEVFVKADASAALAASIFHYETTGIISIKKYLKSKGITVRL